MRATVYGANHPVPYNPGDSILDGGEVAARVYMDRIALFTAAKGFAAQSGSPDSPFSIDLGGEVFGMALDPETSTPGLRIAVQPDGLSSPVILRPGDAPVMFKDPISRIRYWNMDADIYKVIWGAGSNFGQFVVASLIAIRQPSQAPGSFSGVAARMVVTPILQVVLQATQGRPASFPGGATDFLISTGGLKRIRLGVIPRSGANVVAAPADLAATIRAYVLHPLSSGAAGAAQATLSAIAPENWTMIQPANPIWMPLDGSDFAVTQTKLAKDLDVQMGGVIAFRLESLTGTGVDRISLIAMGA